MGTVADLGGDGGGEVAADPPPERGGGVLVGQVRPIGRRAAQQLGGVEAGAGDRGEPFGQQRGELVVADAGRASRAVAPFPERGSGRR